MNSVTGGCLCGKVRFEAIGALTGSGFLLFGVILAAVRAWLTAMPSNARSEPFR